VLVAIAGGVGAARLLAGLVRAMDPAGIMAVVNTGDDMTLHGLHISPDIDTITYTLAGRSNPATGWGLAGDTFSAMAELADLGGQAWFGLGDRDLATHLYRTQRLAEGASLSAVTAELAARRGVALRVVPMSDDPVRTRLSLDPAGVPATGFPGIADPDDVAFQDYFVRLRHGVPVRAVRFDGAERSRPAPGVLEAIEAADEIVVCPSNPLVSIGPVLAVPGIADALARRRPDVVAVSPIVAGQALKGPADRLLRELGHESSVLGVARLYAPWAGSLVVDVADAALAPAVEEVGLHCIVVDTVMSSPGRSLELARRLLGARR
jgi:LPPG:FO 2-phospho-L-lactate transferase